MPVRCAPQNSDINPADFTHKLFMVPSRTCANLGGIAALAQQNCAWYNNCYTWLFGETAPRSVAHEVRAVFGGTARGRLRWAGLAATGCPPQRVLRGHWHLASERKSLHTCQVCTPCLAAICSRALLAK